MCPPLSCCHRRGTPPSLLRQQLYYLVRLLLASGSAEVPAAQQAALATRLDALWNCLHSALRQYYRVPQARAQELTMQVVHGLLQQACCRQSVRDTISLAEALGQPEAPARPDWVPAPPAALAELCQLWPVQLPGSAPIPGSARGVA